MNLLYLVHRIPYPPNKGDKIRSFHQIQYLSRNHQIHLGCLLDDPRDRSYIECLRKYCSSIEVVSRSPWPTRIKIVSALCRAFPLSVAAFYSRRLEQYVHQLIKTGSIDAIIVFSSAMATYVSRIDHLPKILDYVDVDSEKWRAYAEFHAWPTSYLFSLEAKRLARFEIEMAQCFDWCLFVSKVEAELFRQRIKDGQHISFSPNGVDSEYFYYDETWHFEQRSPTIVFTGAMDYFPNIDAVQYFVTEVFPLVVEQVPEARFYIVGRYPTREVKQLHQEGKIVVTGSVDDVRPFLQQARVAVAPFRVARGVQNKVLEAMAMGTPVVGTKLAFQGLVASQEDGIQVANAPLKMADQIVRLLKDDEYWKRVSLLSRHYVERYHRWEDHGRAIDELLSHLVSWRESSVPVR